MDNAYFRCSIETINARPNNYSWWSSCHSRRSDWVHEIPNPHHLRSTSRHAQIWHSSRVGRLQLIRSMTDTKRNATQSVYQLSPPPYPQIRAGFVGEKIAHLSTVRHKPDRPFKRNDALSTIGPETQPERPGKHKTRLPSPEAIRLNINGRGGWRHITVDPCSILYHCTHWYRRLGSRQNKFARAVGSHVRLSAKPPIQGVPDTNLDHRISPTSAENPTPAMYTYNLRKIPPRSTSGFYWFRAVGTL